MRDVKAKHSSILLLDEATIREEQLGEALFTGVTCDHRFQTEICQWTTKTCVESLRYVTRRFQFSDGGRKYQPPLLR